MRPKFTVDSSSFRRALANIKISQTDLVALEGVGARVQINGQRLRVPVDTAATQNSVNSHIVEASATRVVDEIGPETNYAPYIEYGTPSRPRYPMQPFVRPTATQDLPTTVRAIGTSFGQLVVSRWQR